MSEQFKNAGRVAMVYKEEWNPNSSYGILDVVTYGGATYCMYATISNPADYNLTPAENNSNWFKMANSGADLFLSGVVETYADLPEADIDENQGQLYLVKSDESTEPYGIDILYYSNGQTWVRIGNIQQPSKSIYSGQGMKDGLEDDKQYYIGDLYLDYKTSILYKCSVAGEKDSSEWSMAGRLGGISSTINGTGELAYDRWVSEDESYYQIVYDGINLNLSDVPIIGLNIESDNFNSENINDWNLIYKVEHYKNSEGRIGLKFYATKSISNNLPFFYIGYGFNDVDIYKSWSNATAKINEIAFNQKPQVTTTVGENNVNFDFKIPAQKFEIDAVDVAAAGYPSASINKKENGAWGLTLGIPRSNGEGVPGPENRVTNITYSYYLDTQGTVIPTDVIWASSIPQIIPGKFLWTKVTLSFEYTKDGLLTEFYNVAYQGKNDTEGSGLQDVTAVANGGIRVVNGAIEDNQKTITISHSNTAITPSSNTQSIYKIKYDAYGHITGASAANISDLGGIQAPNTTANNVLLYRQDGAWTAKSASEANLLEKPVSATTGNLLQYNGSDWTQSSGRASKAAINSTGNSLPSNGWEDNQQIVSNGSVVSDSVVLIKPTETGMNYENWLSSGVRCIANGAGTLTFICESEPSTDLQFDMTIFNVL